MKNLLMAACAVALLYGMIMPPAPAEAGHRIVARISDNDNCSTDHVQEFRRERAAVKSYDTVERVTIVPQIQRYQVERIVSPVIEKQYILRSTDSGHCDHDDNAEILLQRELGDVGDVDYGGHCNASQRSTTAYFTSHNDRANLRDRLEDRRDDRQRQRDNRQRQNQKQTIILELNDNGHHHGNRQQNRQQQRRRSSENVTLKFRSR